MNTTPKNKIKSVFINQSIKIAIITLFSFSIQAKNKFETFTLKVNYKSLISKDIDSTKNKKEVDKKEPTKIVEKDFLKTEASKKKNTTAIFIITYRIYPNGKIEKFIPKLVKKEFENKYRYVYFDNEGNKYQLGDFTIQKTQKFRGKKGTYVNLISLEEIPKYYKKGKHQYQFYVDSPRSYVNEKTLASFFGAMFEVNFLDISCNGFSHKDGSSKPSKSHINGNNGDFKYLRIDKAVACGPGTSLNIIKSPDSLDYARQNKWNDALYKFGWKKMLGWTYKVKGITKKLSHISHNTKDHYHHLHLQQYKPNYDEVFEYVDKKTESTQINTTKIVSNK